MQLSPWRLATQVIALTGLIAWGISSTGICAYAAADDATSVAQPGSSFTSLQTKIEALVHQYYPKAKISKTASKFHFEFKTKDYDIPQTDTIEPGPQWGGVWGNIEWKEGCLNDDDGNPKQLNQYSYYVVIEFHPSSKTDNCHLDVRLEYPFDVQPEFLQSFKSLIRNFDQTARS